MRLILLGTGTPSPSLRRQSAGYLVEMAADRVVLDHGAGAHHRLLEAGRSASDVTHALLTHLHSDHILDFPRLVLQRWDKGAGHVPELKVYGPPPLAAVCDRFFGSDGAFAPDIRARCEHAASLAIFAARGGRMPRRPPAPEVREVRPGEVIDAGAWRAVVGFAQHVQPHLACVAYRLEEGAASLVYTGDTGYSEKIIELARGCDALIAMCQYTAGTPLPPEATRTAASHIDVARMVAAAGARMLVLTHISQQLDEPLAKARVLRDIATLYAGDIVWGEDLMELTIGAEPAGRPFD
jgi:ribonuclease BN (tRNA processing enzyme)